ncbi:hypothetical protein [Chryseobacterium sp. IT-36CA2]|uniref:hypothetical protein n=1 Tax=Chryseobacterium sp. IT-36CA2 TaxID=3026460 RepID=UPI0039E0CFDE
MKNKSTLYFVLLFPIFFQIMVYYGFESSYYPYKYQEAATNWYYMGIYQYRFLSREAVDVLTMFLKKIMAYQDFPLKTYIQKKGTSYYHALFLYNTFFAVGTSWILNFILKNRLFFPGINTEKRMIIVLIMTLVSAMSQYVIVHYDNAAIFLLLCGFYFSFQYYHNGFSQKYLYLLGGIIVVSTLNRETSCLNISFFGSLLLFNMRLKKENILYFIKSLFIPICAFILPYIILRFLFPQKSGDDYYIFESITLGGNLTGINHITGWLYAFTFIRFIYFFIPTIDNRRLANYFLILSLPYIIMICLVGILWETRLFIPLFYGLIVLAFFNFKKETNNLDS